MEVPDVLTERQSAILSMVIDEYVQTAEPVSSKALVDRRRLEVSTATIRNELARLEAEGYVTHPYTSAGRVPSDLGYRFYVEALMAEEPVGIDERRYFKHGGGWRMRREIFTVNAPHGFPVRCNVRHIDARADDLFQRGSDGFERPADVFDGLAGLGGRVAAPHEVALRIRGRRAGHKHPGARLHGPGISDNGLPGSPEAYRFMRSCG